MLCMNRRMLATLCLLTVVNVFAFSPSPAGRRILSSMRRYLTDGVQQAIGFLNTQPKLAKALALCDTKLKDEMDGANFWSAGNFIVQEVTCEGIVPEGLRLSAKCEVKGKSQIRKLTLPFPYPVTDETVLK